MTNAFLVVHGDDKVVKLVHQDPGCFLSHFGLLASPSYTGLDGAGFSQLIVQEPDPQSIPIGDLNLQNLGGEQIRRSVAG